MLLNGLSSKILNYSHCDCYPVNCFRHLRRQKKTSPSPEDDQNDEQNGQQSIQNQQALAQLVENYYFR